jgi:hypothetical protein
MKNIEETEKAKRDFYEQRKGSKGINTTQTDEAFAAARCE